MREIYLDHNATAPILPEVASAIQECYESGYANPASPHQAGRRARKVLEDARDLIGRILGARVEGAFADRVILTSGGTEANNLALRGLAGAPGGRIVISPIEHPSVLGPAEILQQLGWRVDQLDVDRNGIVRLSHLDAILAENCHTQDAAEAADQVTLVSVMLGNNETGVLQPVAEVARRCRRHGVRCHTDAVQVVGKCALGFRELGVDAMSLSAHKFHGPRGVGALIVKHGVPLQPILFGGFQQQGDRPGTESVSLAVGLCRALELWQREAEARHGRLESLRNRFEAALRCENPRLVINGAEVPRLPHTSNVAFPGLDRQALLMALDQQGVACSTGSACASGSSEPSHVLSAMGCETAIIAGSLRVSLGASTTVADVDEAVRRILLVINRLVCQNQTPKLAQSPPAAGEKRV